MKRYQLMTRHEWQKILDERRLQENERRQSFSLTTKFYDTFERYDRVKYFHPQEYDPVIHYCVNNADQCTDLFSTLDKLGLYRGRDLYNNDSARVTAALTTAITSEQAILVELPPVYSCALLPPSPMKSNLLMAQEANKIGQYDPRDFCRKIHEDEENWIELNIEGLNNQPFTLFNSTTDLVVHTGRLDNKGHAYVKLPFDVKYVDILFDHQKVKREWYYDIPLQSLGGVRDAAQSNLDLFYETLRNKIINDRFNDYLKPSQIAFEWLTNDKNLTETITGQYHSIFANLESFKNPIELPIVAPADSAAGAMIRGVSQFLTDFIPAFKCTKFLKPLGRFGTYGRGTVSGIIADVAAFEPHEERLSNLVQEYPKLRNPITDYLQASPDDSSAEGRFKNAIEGLIGGALGEVLVKSLRIFKYSRFKSLYSNIRTKVKYRLEITYPDGIHFNVIQKSHMAEVESFTQRKAIKGGHNSFSFYEAVSQYNIKILSETSSKIKGIKHIKYLIPAKDGAGNIIGYKGKTTKDPFKKTIYDPHIISDEKILELGQQAAARHYEKYLSKGERGYNSHADGIKFRIYLDPKTGLITNYHPKL